MIVQCCICKVIEGVKCPICRDGKTMPAPNAAAVLFKDSTFVCDADHTFVAAQGGYSHGYCPSCFKQVMSKIPKKVPAFALYLQ